LPPRITVLGAGPAGLWTALTLLERDQGFDVTVLEADDSPGGLTASFGYRGLTFDYGSHRLHPATSPDILERIRGMLGEGLLTRPRNGRILLENRFIAFPLKPADLIFHLPPSFPLGVLFDTLTGPFRRKREDTFQGVLLEGLGPTISRRFYFPYAEKLWGLPPGSLSPVQARRRVSSGSLGSMAGRILSRGGSAPRIFYYPEEGFGQIARETADRIRSLGGRILYNSRVKSVRIPGQGQAGSVSVLSDEGVEMIQSDFVFSTIPVTELAGMLRPSPPVPVLEAAGRLACRSMVYCFLELSGRPYTVFDAHYFPGPEVAFSRMSEPSNYSCSREPADRTGLCFEIPCSECDNVWNLPDDGVRDLVLRDLSRTGLPGPDVISSVVRRRRNVYPVYRLGFEEPFGRLDGFLVGQGRLVSLGRQGLYAHDNTHHTIEMGVAAAGCLGSDLSWDSDAWSRHRERFREHVVVD
jgi:protoporphyrinogen oxidase